MATSIIGGGLTAPTPREREAVEFFTLNAKYLIDPESTTDNIGSDVGCMHEVLIATLQALLEAATGRPLERLVLAALYQAKQVSAMASEYFVRTYAAAGNAELQSEVKKMGEALNEAADARHGINASLLAMLDQVHSHCDSNAQGHLEAAIASTERLDRSLSVGLEAWGGR